METSARTRDLRVQSARRRRPGSHAGRTSTGGKRAMSMEHVHPHRETEAHPRHAPSSRRMRRRDSFEHLDERLRALRDALRTAKQGDFSARLPTDGGADGVMGEVALAFNALIEVNDALVSELRRVDRSVGVEGRTT